MIDRVTLEAALLERYARFSLYNSPYPAHDGGRAIDLYPGTRRDGRTTAAPSPVSGTVLDTRTVRAPPKPYAPEHDHLILLDCETEGLETGGGRSGGVIARVLHVDPAVEPGDRIDAGDTLGRLVRAGFFAPWVDNHLHVGFRRPDQHLERASGSLPISLGADFDLRPLEWGGRGTVVETGDTYAVLDRPAHPDPGRTFVGIAADGGGVLDGGIPHYEAGGVLGLGASVGLEPDPLDGASSPTTVSQNGNHLGYRTGRTIAWDDIEVTVDGTAITGLSCFCAQDGEFGAKLICPGVDLSVGDSVRVRVRPRG